MNGDAALRLRLLIAELEDLWNIDSVRIRREWELRLHDFTVSIEAWFHTQTAEIVAEAEARINIETMRIILVLEATAEEFRLREEGRI